MLSITQLKERFSAEQILMVLITRLHFGTQPQEEVAHFIDAHVIDWSLFYKIIKSHGVRAFIYNIIITQKLNVDKTFESKLKNDALQTTLRNLHQLKFVHQLTNTFLAMGIRVIPHKGVGFAGMYYPSLGWRESSDIDFLVHPQQVPLLRQYFRENAYEAKVDVTDKHLHYFIRFFKELVFITPKNNSNIKCSVELQWRLMDAYLGNYADYNFFIPHLETVIISGQTVPTLSPTYNYLCLIINHFVKDQLSSFKYVVDMACIAQKNNGEIDTIIIQQVIQRFAINNTYKACVATINDLLGIQLPCFDAKIPHKHSAILNNALLYPTKPHIALDNHEALALMIIHQDNILQKIRLKLRVAFCKLLPNKIDLELFPNYNILQLFFRRPFRLWQKNYGKQ